MSHDDKQCSIPARVLAEVLEALATTSIVNRHVIYDKLKPYRENYTASAEQRIPLGDTATAIYATPYTPNAVVPSDVETMRTALRQIAEYVAVNEMTVAPSLPAAPRHMQAIARAALLKSAAPSHAAPINAAPQSYLRDPAVDGDAGNAPAAAAPSSTATKLPEWIERQLRGFEHVTDFTNWTLSAGAIRVLLARLAPSASATHPDTARLDALETLIWSKRIGNGLAIFPTTGVQDEVRHVVLQDLGQEDGSNLGDELTDTQMTLRDAIDAAISLTERTVDG